MGSNPQQLHLFFPCKGRHQMRPGPPPTQDEKSWAINSSPDTRCALDFNYSPFLCQGHWRNCWGVLVSSRGFWIKEPIQEPNWLLISYVTFPSSKSKETCCRWTLEEKKWSRRDLKSPSKQYWESSPIVWQPQRTSSGSSLLGADSDPSPLPPPSTTPFPLWLTPSFPPSSTYV